MIKRFLSKYSQFGIFLIVGVLNTLFGYAIFCLLIYLGLHYMIAVLLATCLGVLFNFKTIGRIVFKSKANHLLPRFIAVYTLLYFINVGIIKVTGHFLDDIYLRGLISTTIVAILGYTLNKKWVFNKPNA